MLPIWFVDMTAYVFLLVPREPAAGPSIEDRAIDFVILLTKTASKGTHVAEHVTNHTLLLAEVVDIVSPG